MQFTPHRFDWHDELEHVARCYVIRAVRNSVSENCATTITEPEIPDRLLRGLQVRRLPGTIRFQSESTSSKLRIVGPIINRNDLPDQEIYCLGYSLSSREYRHRQY